MMIPWCQTTSCLFNLMEGMKWSKMGRGANRHFARSQEVWLRSLTPPTGSKWLSPLVMSCPLKAQEKDTSRTGSLATWQGNTMLSPTMISMSTGPWVILVGSAPEKKPHIVRGSHFWPRQLRISHRTSSISLQQHEHCRITRTRSVIH